MFAIIKLYKDDDLNNFRNSFDHADMDNIYADMENIFENLVLHHKQNFKNLIDSDCYLILISMLRPKAFYQAATSQLCPSRRARPLTHPSRSAKFPL